MPFSLLVLDASEPRQTGMDIWRESGNRLAVLMPAPQKHSYTLMSMHEHTHLHKHTYRHSFVSVEPSPTSCCPIISEAAPHTCIVGIFWKLLRLPVIHLGQGAAGVQDRGWTALAKKAPTHGEREGGMGRRIKAKAVIAELCPARIAFPPSHLCLRAFHLARVRVGSFCVRVVCCLLTAGLEILSKSHRLSSV